MNEQLPRTDSLGLVTNVNVAAAIDSTPIPTILYDTAGRVQLWNPAAERLLGWKAEEVIGKLPPHLAGRDPNEVRGLIAAVVAGEVIEGQRVHRQRRDGRIVTAKLSTAPIKDDAGTVVGIVSMLLDETDLVESAEARTRAESGFEALFREAPVPILRLDLSALMDALAAMTQGVNDIGSQLAHRSGVVRDLLRLARVTDSNDAAILGLATTQDAADCPILSTALDDDQLVGLATALLRGESRFSADLDGPGSGDRPGYWRIHIAVARDQDHLDFSRVYLVVLDLTDIRTAHRTEEFQASILHSIPDAVIGIDGRQEIDYWGPGAERLLGWTEDETEGRPVTVLGRWADGAEGPFRAISVADGVEIKAKRKDGSTVDVLVTSSPGIEGGRVVVAKDLTVRKTLERDLHQRVLHTRALLDSLEYPTALISMSGAVVDSNKAWLVAENDPEVPFGGAIGTNYLLDLTARAEIGDVDLAAGLAGVLEVLAGRRNKCSIEYCATRDDQATWYAMDAVRFAGPQPGAVITHRDITGSRLSADEMANSVDVRDKFIAVLSHQIRTPLTALVGFSRILAEVQNVLDADEIQEILGLLVEQSEDLSALVDNLITDTRATEGILSIETTTVDIAEEIEAVLGGLTATEKQRIIFHPTPVLASADPWRVRQVIRNLVLNSLRHGEDPIEVEVRTNSHHVHVVVSDTRADISPERLRQVFRDFTEGDTVTHWTRTMGLGVAQRLARLMHGDVLFRQTGRTELDFQLPLAS